MLSVALCGAAEAGEIVTSSAAAMDLAALQPFVPLSNDAILSSDEIVALGKQDRIDILPASAMADPVRPEPTNSPVANFINGVQYNLQHIDVSQYGDYSFDVFWDQTKSIKWDLLALYGGITVFGIKNWDWGSSGYNFQSEGWFGEDTKYGGIDKLGHAYTGYVVSQYFTQRIAHTVDDPTNAAITGALLGMGFQTYIEFFDGFAGEHGFSYEDLIADGVGAGFSFLRNTVPGLAEKVDFRLEYWGASDYHDWDPFTDYDGQRYVLALKLAGFEKLEQTPLRFVELQAGYYTEGYTDETRKAGVEPSRNPYVAVGLNLNELLGEAPDVRNTLPGDAAAVAFTYWQPPYTYVSSSYHD
ncbi:DUF2279 domain-containing protein [Aestuariivirga litoralis]|nr:DUF2279 domain-containing protein [Aestuariivirga litoralis]